jgi:hypothetical protein
MVTISRQESAEGCDPPVLPGSLTCWPMNQCPSTFGHLRKDNLFRSRLGSNDERRLLSKGRSGLWTTPTRPDEGAVQPALEAVGLKLARNTSCEYDAGCVGLRTAGEPTRDGRNGNLSSNDRKTSEGRSERTVALYLPHVLRRGLLCILFLDQIGPQREDDAMFASMLFHK